MKITLKQLLAIAKGLKDAPYKGSDTDPEAVRKHFLDSGFGSFTLANGDSVDIQNVEIEVPAPTKKSLNVVLDEPAEDKTPADLNVAIQAGIESALKAKGLDGATLKRPGFVNPDEDSQPQIKVRSEGERAWDAHVASNKSASGLFFKSYERAALFRDMLLADIIAKNPKHDRDPEWSSGVQAATKRLKSGVHGKAYATFPNAAGGALTATEFSSDLIQNVNQFGASRQLGRTVAMAEKKLEIPVATGIPSVLFPEEGVANTDDTAEAFSNVNLDAKTAVITAKLSRQILQDARIGMVDFFAMEFARGFANKRDNIFFNGDGTASFGHMAGLKTAFGNLGTLATVAGTGGGVVVGGSTGINHTIGNFQSMVGLCQPYALPNARWTCSQAFWANNMLRLGQVQGGSPGFEVIDGLPRFRFMGFPVVFNHVVNIDAGDDGANSIDCYFGDFSRSVVTGDRMSFEFDTDSSIYFTSYAVAIRGVERYHTVVHDVGTTTAAGPVVCLVQS